MVPKVENQLIDLKKRFGAGLFDMVPKEQYVDLTESIRFNTSLFDTVPKVMSLNCQIFSFIIKLSKTTSMSLKGKIRKVWTKSTKEVMAHVI